MAKLLYSENPALAKQLEEEYKILSQRWDDFDRRALGIKSWIAVGSMVVFIAVSQTAPDGSARTDPAVLFVAALIVLIVWFVEAIWKSWQHSYYDRIEEIEQSFRNEHGRPLFAFQTFASWRTANKGKDFNWCLALKEMWRPFVCLPYLPIIVLLIGYLLYRL